MDLHDTPDRADFRRRLREWLGERLPSGPVDGAPAEVDLARLLAWSTSLHEAGYAGLTWPAEHGGRGLPPAYQGIFAEECALAGAPDQLNVIGLNMVGPTLIRFGTQAQQRRHLTPILRGEHLFCQGFSEPEAGSDLAAVRTRADAVPHGYVINGDKVWSSYAHVADFCLLLARTGEPAARHRGLTCFLVDLRAEGVLTRPLRQINGESNFSQITLADVSVGEDAVLGEVGGGWPVALTTLAHERGTFAITLSARLRVQFERLLATVRATGRAGDPDVRASVARLHIDLQALRYTGYRALTRLSRTGDPGPETSILKLHWSQTHQRLTRLAWELLGPEAALDAEDAFWSGYWQSQLLRSRGDTIAGGTSEILRGIVAERVAGLPRSR
ncbi:acyl-CoA dehydrogenase [Solihabitans fulvus]|uniref:Acyl-CoA dehydrogenase n=1 Tax=Solihabitans fulvus TaxID=1892852 RepID=A0A5B2XS70_9PSEU|nr:acyl-CoA dehydrogenase family protein [Solihabitans fulvus]KAA2265810.1 acyl-CoA dehydrogenase [Solihabitans fulvus]